jgi:hypothetical protein
MSIFILAASEKTEIPWPEGEREGTGGGEREKRREEKMILVRYTYTKNDVELRENCA